MVFLKEYPIQFDVSGNFVLPKKAGAERYEFLYPLLSIYFINGLLSYMYQ